MRNLESDGSYYDDETLTDLTYTLLAPGAGPDSAFRLAERKRRAEEGVKEGRYDTRNWDFSGPAPEEIPAVLRHEDRLRDCAAALRDIADELEGLIKADGVKAWFPYGDVRLPLLRKLPLGNYHYLTIMLHGMSEGEFVGHECHKRTCGCRGYEKVVDGVSMFEPWQDDLEEYMKGNKGEDEEDEPAAAQE